MKYLKLILFIATISFFSCGEKAVFKEYKKIENNNWTFEKKELKFEAEIIEIDKTYDIVILLRHASFYPYDHLHVQFTMDSPQDERRSKSHMIQVKGEDGKFVGDGLGDMWDLEYPVYSGLKFKEAGTYTFFIDKLMKKYNTPGVMEVGLLIKESAD